MAKSRQAVVNLVESWDGKKESNGSHKSIIDLYNDFFEKICAGKFPRGIRMRYDWAWCACTWSALAAALRYESIMPMEISCYYLIEAAKKMDVGRRTMLMFRVLEMRFCMTGRITESATTQAIRIMSVP